MKMLKKMAALLLAGVMAMALLTACGDDSAPSFAQKTEDAAFAAAKKVFTNIQVNDADLKKFAGEKIDQIDTEKGTFDVKNAAYSKEDLKKFRDAVALPNGKASMTAVLPLGEKQDDDTYKVMEITADNIGTLNQGTDDMKAMLDGLNQMAAAGGKSINITKIGVAAKTVKSGKTYAAIAMTIEVTPKVTTVPQN